jgi:threonine dehydrogenase-like Zn-dependent dehydrogenase
MKAIAVVPGEKGTKMIERSEPAIRNPDEVKMKILQTGICGTDREEINGGRAMAPTGQQDLVIGHEMIGRVVEIGNKVTRVRPGDYGIFTVRRGCGECLPCLMNRPDMCKTGKYEERGIWGLDGYQTEYVVDTEPYLIPVPDEIRDVAVLSEPLSIAEKAIAESVRIQESRIPDAGATPGWLSGKRCLVAGRGPIGLLSVLALSLRGVVVYSSL